MTVICLPTNLLPPVELHSFLEKCRGQQAVQLEVVLAVLPALPSPDTAGPETGTYRRESPVFMVYGASDLSGVNWREPDSVGTLNYVITDRVCRTPVQSHLARYAPLEELQQIAEARAQGCAQMYERLLQAAGEAIDFSVQKFFLYEDNGERVPFGEPITSAVFRSPVTGVVPFRLRA